MSTTATASTGYRTRHANLKTLAVLTSVVLGALALSGCPTRSAATDVDGEGEVAPDAGMGAAGATVMPPNGGSTGSGGSHASDGGTPPADAGSKPPSPNQACTVAAQCASGFCVDGVCCDTACDGACESCAADGQDRHLLPGQERRPTTPARAARPATPRVPAARISAGAVRRTSSARPAAASTVSAARPARARRARRARSLASRESARPSPGSSTTVTCSSTNSCNGQGVCRGKNGSHLRPGG